MFKSDYLNQTLPAKEELITLSRPQVRRMSTGNSCDSNMCRRPFLGSEPDGRACFHQWNDVAR